MLGDEIIKPTAVPSRIALGVRDAGVALGLSARTIEALAQTGELPSFKVGRRRLFSVAVLERWVADCAAEAQQQEHT